MSHATDLLRQALQALEGRVSTAEDQCCDQVTATLAELLALCDHDFV